MAQAVEEALDEKRHLIVEAGTGTGKTLAYLLPVIRSGKRVIISTGTKNLQEQLFNKDVPFLEQALFPNGEGRLNVCYMKGRNNYLCKKKLYDLTDQPVLSGLEEIEHYRAIAAWEKTTQTGDRAELAELPEASALWHKLDARSDTCLGQKCSAFDTCFITEMHRKAMESDIIIVNHHLFFADLGIKQQAEDAPDAGILPDCGAVIFDEAHELEDVAGSYFGITLSNVRIEELARDEALGDGHDLRVELPRGQGDPGSVLLRLVLDEHSVGRAGDALGEQVVEVLRGVDLDAQREVELVHAGSSDRGAKCALRIRDVRPDAGSTRMGTLCGGQVAASPGM